jgi:hypothetical protein
VSLDAGNYISIVSAVLGVVSLSLAIPAYRRSGYAFRQAHRPIVTISAGDGGDNLLLVPLTVTSDDPRTFRRVTIELIDPEPNPETIGFGTTPPTTATCSVGPLRPGRTLTFPQPLAMAHSGGKIRIKVTIRQTVSKWPYILDVDTPYDLTKSVH